MQSMGTERLPLTCSLPTNRCVHFTQGVAPYAKCTQHSVWRWKEIKETDHAPCLRCAKKGALNLLNERNQPCNCLYDM